MQVVLPQKHKSEMKRKHIGSGSKLVSLVSFPRMITVTLNAPRFWATFEVCDGNLSNIPKRDFIFARVKTGQVGS